jgi:hypothetical protein
MKRASIYLILGVLAATASPLLADDAEYRKVRDGMSKLAPLIGKWNAAWTFHQGDGITRELGTTSITSVLDDTYLQLAVERHNEADPKRSRKMLTFVTFNPTSNQYDSTYLYSRSPMRVTETGEFDDRTREFRTTAFIPREDGVHDENVRTVMSLRTPDRVVYQHYSRYSHEASERMDLEIVLTRAP